MGWNRPAWVLFCSPAIRSSVIRVSCLAGIPIAETASLMVERENSNTCNPTVQMQAGDVYSYLRGFSLSAWGLSIDDGLLDKSYPYLSTIRKASTKEHGHTQIPRGRQRFCSMGHNAIYTEGETMVCAQPSWALVKGFCNWRAMQKGGGYRYSSA